MYLIHVDRLHKRVSEREREREYQRERVSEREREREYQREREREREEKRTGLQKKGERKVIEYSIRFAAKERSRCRMMENEEEYGARKEISPVPLYFVIFFSLPSFPTLTSSSLSLFYPSFE